MMTEDAQLRCPYCKNPVASSETTCSVCGMQLPKFSKRASTPPKVVKPKAVAKKPSARGKPKKQEPEVEVPVQEETPPEAPAPAAPGPGEELADCPVCGMLAPVSATSCPKCGAEFEPEEPGGLLIRPSSAPERAGEADEEEEAECPICDSKVKITDTACPFCGAEFEPEEAEPAEVPAPPAAPPPPAAEDEDVSCPVCGEVVGATVTKCPHCGSEFEEGEVEEVPAFVPDMGPPVSEEEVLCPICGNRVGAVVVACPYCGAEFETEEETQGAVLHWSGPPKEPEGILRPAVTPFGDTRRGISNGTSAINGVSLVNGVGQAAGPSRINGTGATNGRDLVNGRGLSNGAVNGRRGGGRASRRDVVLKRWQLLAIFVVAALIIPAALFLTFDTDEAPFTIDGDFDDWDDVARLTYLSPADSPSIDVVEWAVAEHEGTVYLYLETASPTMAGDRVEGFVLFIDADGSVDTGYDLSGFGADAMIEVQGWNGSVSVARCSSFGSTGDRLDWSAWRASGGATCSFEGARLEASARLLTAVNGTSEFMLLSMDEDGPGCRSSHAPLEGGLLIVEQVPSEDIAADGILQNRTDVLISTLRFACERSGGTVYSVSPEFAGIGFLGAVEQFSIESGGEHLVELRSDTSLVSAGQFVSVAVTAEDVSSSFTCVEVVGPGAKAYVGEPPGGIAIDGAFADWTGRTVADVDIEPVENPNIDIAEVGGANG